MNNDVEIIMGRLTLLFKRQSRTRYWLMIANDPYDQTYNVFFNSPRANERLQSVPLHKLANYDLADLETLLKALRQKIKLTIEFVGFTGERWPKPTKPAVECSLCPTTAAILIRTDASIGRRVSKSTTGNDSAKNG